MCGMECRKVFLLHQLLLCLTRMMCLSLLNVEGDRRRNQRCLPVALVFRNMILMANNLKCLSTPA